MQEPQPLATTSEVKKLIPGQVSSRPGDVAGFVEAFKERNDNARETSGDRVFLQPTTGAPAAARAPRAATLSRRQQA